MQASGDANFKKVSIYTSVPDQLTHPKGGGIFGKVTSLVSFPIHTYVYAQCTFIGTLSLLVHFINQLFHFFPLNGFHFSSSKQLLLEAELCQNKGETILTSHYIRKIYSSAHLQV